MVCTGATSEDRACAEHIARLIEGRVADSDALRAAVLAAGDEHMALWRRHRAGAEVAEFRADLERCADVDRYPFAMVGQRDRSSICLTRRDVLGMTRW